MIYIIGDKHTDFGEVFNFCYTSQTTHNSILIVLGVKDKLLQKTGDHYPKLL